MAKNVFDPEVKRTIFLNIVFPGFALGNFVPGHFEADTVEFGEKPAVSIPSNFEEFAVFHVDEPANGAYPHRFVGTYRIPVDELKMNHPELFVVPEPEQPEPEPADQENSEPVE